MIPRPRVRTERLDLVPSTPEMLRSDARDHDTLGRLLDAAIPASWPPPLLDEETRAQFIALLVEGTDPQFCSWYWVREAEGNTGRVLIGSGGTASSTGLADTVMIGYSVLDEFQNRGYATEAVRHLLPVIFSDLSVRRVLATTCPDLPASLRVLEKTGFIPCAVPDGEGAGMEEGTLCFVRER